jgi:hypothetical protein
LRSSASGDGEDEGHDGIFANLLRALLARFVDHVVLSFLFEVLPITYNFIADE